MSLDYTSHPADIPESTLVQLFLEAVDRFGDKIIFERLTSPTTLEGIS